MFGSRKSISGKYSIFRKCYFPEKKMFSCVWLHFKKFSKKYFLEFGEEEGKDKPRRRRRQRDLDLRKIAIDGAIASLDDRRAVMIAPLVDRLQSIAIDKRARWTIAPLVGRLHRSSIDDQCSPIWALSSLSLSLFPKMI